MANPYENLKKGFELQGVLTEFYFGIFDVLSKSYQSSDIENTEEFKKKLLETQTAISEYLISRLKLLGVTKDD